MEKALLFCGEFIVIDKRHPDRTKKFFKAGELLSIDTILGKCRDEEMLGLKKFLEGYH